MTVNSQVSLAIVNLVFYIIASILVIYCIFKLGFARRSGWYFLAILCLIRIIGEPMVIATNGVLDLSNGVSIGGYSLSSVGLSPLLLAGGGWVVAFNSAIGSKNSKIPPQFLRLWALVPLAALIISIIGNTDLASSNAGTRQEAMTLRTVASALYIVTYLLLALMTFMSVPVASLAERGPRLQMYSVIPTLPLLAVRVIYQCLTTFGSQENQFANSNNIWEKAFMGSLTEFLVVIIYLGVGFYVAKAAPPREHRARVGNGTSEEHQLYDNRLSYEEHRRYGNRQ